MNCKQGDLAIVVKCRNAPENIGAIRVCARLCDCWGGWELDRGAKYDALVSYLREKFGDRDAAYLVAGGCAKG